MFSVRGSVLLLFLLVSAVLSGGTFPSVETELVDGSAFTFPDQAVAAGPALFALPMGESRENGELQQQLLLQWHRELLQPGVLPDGLEMYHFPVIESPPRFVRGIIRRGIGRIYAEAVPRNRAAVLFVDDAEAFSARAGIPIDDQPSIALVTADGGVAGYIKGGYAPWRLEKLLELIEETNK